MALVDGEVTSSSTIVRIALESLGCWKAAPPVGFDNVSSIVSLPSSHRSCEMSTLKVLLVSPAANRSVPRVVVKSHRGEATPLAFEHGKTVIAALSSGVAKSTVTGRLVPPDRTTVMVITLPFSLTEYVG